MWFRMKRGLLYLVFWRNRISQKWAELVAPSHTLVAIVLQSSRPVGFVVTVSTMLRASLSSSVPLLSSISWSHPVSSSVHLPPRVLLQLEHCEAQAYNGRIQYLLISVTHSVLQCNFNDKKNQKVLIIFIVGCRIIMTHSTDLSLLADDGLSSSARRLLSGGGASSMISISSLSPSSSAPSWDADPFIRRYTCNDTVRRDHWMRGMIKLSHFPMISRFSDWLEIMVK